MRALALILMLIVSGLSFAQNEGDVKDIDGQVFKYTKGIWVHEALGGSYTLSDEYTSVHKDPKWNKWNAEGDATVKKILELGPNIVFKWKAKKDNQFHTWAVFRNNKLAAAAIKGGSVAVAAGLGGGAAAGAAGAAAGAAGAAAASSGTILGMTAATAAVVGGAVVAGGVIVANNDDADGASSAKR